MGEGHGDQVWSQRHQLSKSFSRETDDRLTKCYIILNPDGTAGATAGGGDCRRPERLCVSYFGESAAGESENVRGRLREILTKVWPTDY
jgi:hypothetical protein